MKDVIIGAVYNLSWDQCKNWVNSINRSGFDGHKVVCMFGSNNDLVDRFIENKFEVYEFRDLMSEEHICAARFSVYNLILDSIESPIRNVIATDVTDVIFQKNPSAYLDRFEFEGEVIITSSENIKYKDEGWGAHNMNISFGIPAFERMKESTIINAGVMAGSYRIMRDLFFAVSAMCTNRNQHIAGGGGPDQAAYNLLMSLYPFQQHQRFIRHDEGWACQVGTVADPRKDYSAVNIDPAPTLDGNVIKTSTGVDYFIVHQYNRNPLFTQVINEKFK
jgi:hypothetical protein